MNAKILLLWTVLAIVASATTTSEVKKPEMEPKIEDSTESPIADMAMIDAEMKTSTAAPIAAMSAVTPVADKSADKRDTQRHTVADFIIHPLIAFKPHAPEDEEKGDVKQATDGGGSTTTTPSPWQLFGFNTGQGLGSSVSSLAGSVTGWLNDRIQLPGLVDSPIQSSTTSTSTTTTQRPDVVVRVQHKSTTRRPLIAINNRNRPNRPNRVNNNNNNNNNNLNFDSNEDDDQYDDEQYDDDEDDNGFEEDYDNNVSNPPRRPNRVNRPNRQNNRQRPQVHDDQYDDDSQSDENEDDFEDDDDDVDEDDEEVEEVVQRPNRRRPVQNNNNRRRQQQNSRPRNPQRNRFSVGSQRQQGVAAAPSQRRQQQQQQQPAGSAEEEEESAEGEVEGDDDDNEQFFHGPTRPSTKRSQSAQNNFIQRGQQSLINQIRQLTRGQTPAEIGAIMRKSQQQQLQQQQKEQAAASAAAAAKKRRRNQATLVVNRNGQTIYVAPELLSAGSDGGTLLNPNLQYYTQAVRAGGASQQFPQPPLTVPLKRKGRPTQYITIPWSQLGIAPPDQVVAITEGVQSQPLILNIPQSAVNTMQSPGRKKRPVITSDAVPLLAEASLMDVFKPPKIPPSRHSTAAPMHKPLPVGTPVIIASKPKPANSGAAHLPHRIRPATIVEKAPASIEQSDEQMTAAGNEPAQTMIVQTNEELRNNDGDDFIIVGEDNEPGLTRQVQPVYGEARYVYGGGKPYLEVLNRRRFALQKAGRALAQPEDSAAEQNAEQRIPVQVVSEQKPESETPPAEAAVQPAEKTKPAQAEGQQPMIAEVEEVAPQTSKAAMPQATT